MYVHELIIIFRYVHTNYRVAVLVITWINCVSICPSIIIFRLVGNYYWYTDKDIGIIKKNLMEFLKEVYHKNSHDYK